jgi:hypothetical protein
VRISTLVPEGAEVPGRARRIVRSPRRAALPRRHHAVPTPDSLTSASPTLVIDCPPRCGSVTLVEMSNRMVGAPQPKARGPSRWAGERCEQLCLERDHLDDHWDRHPLPHLTEYVASRWSSPSQSPHLAPIKGSCRQSHKRYLRSAFAARGLGGVPEASPER